MLLTGAPEFSFPLCTSGSSPFFSGIMEYKSYWISLLLKKEGATLKLRSYNRALKKLKPHL